MITSVLASADEVQSWPSNAGIWRRATASLIDYLVVFIPLYIVVAILFTMTNGGVQAKFSLRWNTCYEATLTKSNAALALYDWQFCNTTLFGLKVASWAQGSLSNRISDDVAKSEAPDGLNFTVDASGNFRPAPLEVDFVELLLLFAYMLVCEGRYGQSVGKRWMSIRVHDEYKFDRLGLGFGTAFRRQFIKFLGLWPATLLGAWYALQYWGYDSGIAPDISGAEIYLAWICAGLFFGWPLLICLSVAVRQDAIHDRFAGTTVRMS